MASNITANCEHAARKAQGIMRARAMCGGGNGDKEDRRRLLAVRASGLSRKAKHAPLRTSTDEKGKCALACGFCAA